MSIAPRTNDSILQRQRQRNLRQRGLRAAEVHTQALAVLHNTLSIPRPEGARFSADAVRSVLLYAAATASSLEHAGRSLSDAPSPNTVRESLKPLTLEEVETQLNTALVSRRVRRLLKSPREIACDLKAVPYYGQPQPSEEQFVWTLQAKNGTTRFFVYATLYVIKNNHRYTLAVRACRKEEGLKGAVQWLVQRCETLGGQIRCLYLDRGFYSVEVLRYLMEEADVPFCLAAPQKGTEDGHGLKALVKRCGPGVHAYTVRSPQSGEVAVKVAVVGCYLRGRWGKHQRVRYTYVIHRLPFGWPRVLEKYRHRFGIESSYRMEGQAHATTTSRRALLRLLWVGLSLLLQNLWIGLKWECVSLPRRGGRVIKHRWFTLRRMLSFLRRAIETCYQVVEEVVFVFP